MTLYRIVLMKPARMFIERQSKQNQERLLRSISRLPYEGDVKPLSGHKSAFRLRVGDFRVIYSVYDDTFTVEVVYVGNRGDIYK